jgi:hypothetical protein
LKAFIFISDVIAIVGKHDELSSGIIYLICFAPSLHIQVLLSCCMFRLTQVLLDVQNFMTSVLLEFNAKFVGFEPFVQASKDIFYAGL